MEIALQENTISPVSFYHRVHNLSLLNSLIHNIREEERVMTLKHVTLSCVFI